MLDVPQSLASGSAIHSSKAFNREDDYHPEDALPPTSRPLSSFQALNKYPRRTSLEIKGY